MPRIGRTLPWDSPSATARPWTRWWWLGSCITREEIGRQLALLQRSGFGGVEIQSIYAPEESTVPAVHYLSREWRALLRHTLRAARRLGMGVDLTMGSGWPWGGPWIGDSQSARRLLIQTRAVRGPTRVEDREGRATCVAVVLHPHGSDAGPGIPVTRGAKGGAYWPVPQGEWIATVCRSEPTGETVKRAGPGGEGPLVDPFSRTAVRRHLRAFAPLFRFGLPRARSLFTDSYEVFCADYTPALFPAFAACRGYDLVPWLRWLDDHRDPALSRRLLHDYRVTMEELLHEASLGPWRRWAHRRGMRVRLQAHGSPGALVDAYAAADIPETEAFGRQGLIGPVARMAASAANHGGGKLCSSETFTWMDEHFRQSLDGMRKWVDDFFLAGINHVFFHGVPATPAGAAFPGQLFYAATNVSEHMPWFAHLHGLTRYIARIQAALQQGRYEAEILVYFPMHDVLASPSGSFEEGFRSRLRLCSVASAGEWFERDAAATWRAVHALGEGGYQLDFASDAIVQALGVRGGRLEGRHSSYRVLLFAGCAMADPATLAAAARLARAGAMVWFAGGLPGALRPAADPRGPLTVRSDLDGLAAQGAVRILDIDADICAALTGSGVPGEKLNGFSFIRRSTAGGTHYFIRWNGAGHWHGAVALRARGGAAIVCDPVTGAACPETPEQSEEGVSVHVELEPGRTALVAVGDRLPSLRAPRRSAATGGGPARVIEVEGPWDLAWQDYEGASRSARIDALADWTDIGELGMFSGMVTYSAVIRIDPGELAGREAALDLGDVRESADVTLNNAPIGIAWTRPFTLALPGGLLRAENVLTIRVANLPANRIISMDRRGIRWRKFYFVNIDYKPFDAADWAPLPSGLLGPVTLVTTGVG